MKKHITKEMIKDGLEQGVVRPALERFGLTCHIGNNWFFFGGNEFELTNPNRMGKGLIVSEIMIVLDEWYEDICDGDDRYEDEYLDYYNYLIANI